MTNHQSSSIADGNLQEFFNERLLKAAQNQSYSISPLALTYITSVFVAFHETARFFAQKGVRIPVLADMLGEALDADFYRRVTILRQLGDTSLMVSGYFPEALSSRRCVDLQYYQKMGEIAYSHLSELSENVNVFEELSGRFNKMSNLINEVAENLGGRDYSILKLIELYVNTGSERIFEKLKESGIFPLRPNKDDFSL